MVPEGIFLMLNYFLLVLTRRSNPIFLQGSALISLHRTATAAAKSLQSCPTLCDPIDGSPPGLPIPGILQARTLEWAAISFSNAWSERWKWSRSVVSGLLATPWTAAYQAPQSMGFSRQEYWSGVPLPSPLHCTVTPLSPCSVAYEVEMVSVSFSLEPWPRPGKLSSTGQKYL